jgi:hypothetical protein
MFSVLLNAISKPHIDTLSLTYILIITFLAYLVQFENCYEVVAYSTIDFFFRWSYLFELKLRLDFAIPFIFL